MNGKLASLDSELLVVSLAGGPSLMAHQESLDQDLLHPNPFLPRRIFTGTGSLLPSPAFPSPLPSSKPMAFSIANPLLVGPSFSAIPSSLRLVSRLLLSIGFGGTLSGGRNLCIMGNLCWGNGYLCGYGNSCIGGNLCRVENLCRGWYPCCMGMSLCWAWSLCGCKNFSRGGNLSWGGRCLCFLFLFLFLLAWCFPAPPASGAPLIILVESKTV